MGHFAKVLLCSLSIAKLFEFKAIKIKDSSEDKILENISSGKPHNLKTDQILNLNFSKSSVRGKKLPGHKMQFIKSESMTETIANEDLSLESWHNQDNYQSESQRIKDSVIDSETNSMLHSDSYYGDDLSLVFVTPRPKTSRKSIKQLKSTTTIVPITPKQSQVKVPDSLTLSPETETPQTLQSIFTSEPNDYDFIPHLSFNEVPSVSTPSPSFYPITNNIKDKNLEEILIFSSDFTEKKELFKQLLNKNQFVESDIIIPENDIFTPPFMDEITLTLPGKPYNREIRYKDTIFILENPLYL